MASDREYVTIEGVQIGDDTESGLAFQCVIDDDVYYVPYSQTRARHRNERVKNGDSIEVTRWWAEKEEIDV